MQPPARAPGGYIYFSRFFVTGLSLAWFMAGFSLRRLFAAADTFISYATTIFKFLILITAFLIVSVYDYCSKVVTKKQLYHFNRVFSATAHKKTYVTLPGVEPEPPEWSPFRVPSSLALSAEL